MKYFITSTFYFLVFNFYCQHNADPMCLKFNKGQVMLDSAQTKVAILEFDKRYSAFTQNSISISRVIISFSDKSSVSKQSKLIKDRYEYIKGILVNLRAVDPKKISFHSVLPGYQLDEDLGCWKIIIVGGSKW